MHYVLIWFFATTSISVDHKYPSKTECMAAAKEMIVSGSIQKSKMMICEKKTDKVFSHVESFNQAINNPL